MSSKAMKWVSDHVRIAHPGLTHTVLILAMAADSRGVTWKSQATLAAEMGGSVHTVRKWLSTLDKLNIIQRAHRSNGRGGRSSDLIRLNVGPKVNVTRERISEIFQAAHGATRNASSKRHGVDLQAAREVNDQVSDQQKVVINQGEQPQDQQSAQRGKPALQLLDGGRAA